MARLEMTGLSFFVLIQKYHKLCFENSSCKLCRLITPQTHSSQDRCLALASWNFNCVP